VEGVIPAFQVGESKRKEIPDGRGKKLQIFT